jgi:hypothetical protein
VGHYWPVANKAVDDVIGHQSADSNGSPRFSNDRFGVANGALRIYSRETAWRLPQGRYYKGDTTLTMWVKNIACGGLSKNSGQYSTLIRFNALIKILKNNIYIH